MRSTISLIVLVAALLCAAAQSQTQFDNPEPVALPGAVCFVDLTELYPVPMAAYSEVSQ